MLMVVVYRVSAGHEHAREGEREFLGVRGKNTCPTCSRTYVPPAPPAFFRPHARLEIRNKLTAFTAGESAYPKLLLLLAVAAAVINRSL